MLVLYGNLGVLGLLILQKHTRRPKSTDYSIFRFIQAVVRFLWDAHNCEEAREEEELVVSTPYIEHWNDLIDLWYLGMQVCQPSICVIYIVFVLQRAKPNKTVLSGFSQCSGSGALGH